MDPSDVVQALSAVLPLVSTSQTVLTYTYQKMLYEQRPTS